MVVFIAPLDRILLYVRVPDGSTAMPPVRKALVRTALREDAEKVVFGDRERHAPRPKPTRRRPQGLCLDRGYCQGGSTGSTPARRFLRGPARERPREGALGEEGGRYQAR